MPRILAAGTARVSQSPAAILGGMWILAMRVPKRSMVIKAGSYRFGFTDWEGNFGGDFTTADLGPLGEHSVPFSATLGCALVGTALVLFIVAVVWAGMRRRKSS